MTLDELKAEAAKLPSAERSALAGWIDQCEDVRKVRRTDLIREIEIGLKQLDRGECIVCEDDEALGSFFEGVKSRGRERLAKCETTIHL